MGAMLRFGAGSCSSSTAGWCATSCVSGSGSGISRNVERIRGGLVFKVHRLLYHSTLGSRVKMKKIRDFGFNFLGAWIPGSGFGGTWGGGGGCVVCFLAWKSNITSPSPAPPPSPPPPPIPGAKWGKYFCAYIALRFSPHPRL